MEKIYESLLYVIYNLQNQNQLVTIDAIRQPMGWMQNHEAGIEKGIQWLIANGFLSQRDEKVFVFTDMGRKESYKINRVRAKDDFNRLIQQSTESAAYLNFCEEIYGYRMYLYNMMDKEQLDFLFNTIFIQKSDTILDIGCGAGSILNYLVTKYGCHGMGLDQLSEELVKKNSNRISYIDGDMDTLAGYHLKPTITLSIDSLYFSNDLNGFIKLLTSIENNSLYLFYSQYIFDASTEDKTVLHQDNTKIAGILQKNRLSYKTLDFTTNEHLLYEKALKVLPKYKKAFEKEGKIDVYERKLKENRSGRDLCDKGLASRYLYIVQ